MARKKKTGNERSGQAPASAATAQSPLVGKKLSLFAEDDDAPTIDTSFLEKTRVLRSPENLAETIAPMVADKIGYPDDAREDLARQFGLYFRAIGWITEDVAAQTAGDELPIPLSVCTDAATVGMISPAIRIILRKIQLMIATVRKDNLYLPKSLSFDALESYSSTRYAHQRRHDAAALGNEQTPSGGSDQKLPTFTVPKFDGTTLEGDTYVEAVERRFRNNGQLQFLEDESYCRTHAAWSSAFASRLLDSVADSPILGYLSTNLKKEKNCAIVWTKVNSCLHTSDLTMARIMQHWTDFFGLRCESMDEFLAFYSGVKQVTHKLQEANSIAITDDTFLKAFLAKAVACEELQTEAKRFLQGGNDGWEVILDKVHSDYRAQASGEHLRGGTSTPSTAQLRRGKSSNSASSNKPNATVSRKVEGLAKLPPNTGNLIPHKYYLQFKGWFEAMRVPEKDRTDDQRSYLESFVWKHTTDPKLKRQWAPPNRSDGGNRRNGDGYRSRRARGKRRRDRYSSSESDSDDSYHSRRRSRRGRRRRSPSRSPSRSRSSGKREQDDDDKGSSVSSRRATLFKRK